jgi:hypothetical protein
MASSFDCHLTCVRNKGGLVQFFPFQALLRHVSRELIRPYYTIKPQKKEQGSYALHHGINVFDFF